MARFDDGRELIDAIYEAGVAPDLWPAAMNRISAMIGGAGGLLFGARENYQGTIFGDQLADTFRRFVDEGWATQDPTLPRGLELKHPGFINDQDMFDDHVIETHPVYGFFRREGIGYRAGSIIPNPSGDVVAIVFQRHQEKGPVPRSIVTYLDTLRPHLARASMLSFRFGFEQARAQADALQAIGLPGAVLKRNGGLLAANALFEALMPRVFQARRARLTVADAGADGLFERAVDALSFAQAARSIPIPGASDHLPMVAHVVPVRGAARDVFSQSAALLVVTPIDRAAVPHADLLQGLFDLTPTEARVARAVGAAQTVDEVAAAQGVSRETIRTQVKAILMKTGLTRQSELVSLLAGVGRLG